MALIFSIAGAAAGLPVKRLRTLLIDNCFYPDYLNQCFDSVQSGFVNTLALSRGCGSCLTGNKSCVIRLLLIKVISSVGGIVIPKRLTGIEQLLG